MVCDEPLIVVADHVEKRSAMCKQVFETRYSTEPHFVADWESLEDALGSVQADLVILAWDLPGIDRRTVKERTDELLRTCEQWRGRILILLDNAGYQFERRFRVDVLVTENRETTSEALLEKLDRFFSPPIPWPEVVLPDPPDVVLEHQIARLNPWGSLDLAKESLAEFVHGFGAVGKVRVRSLVQGNSGALVLRVDSIGEQGQRPFALKVSESGDFHKTSNEIENWQAIEKAFDLDGLKRFVPRLLEPMGLEPGGAPFISAGGRFAVAYQFLGGRTGTFVDLEEAYLRGGDGERETSSDIGETLVHRALERLCEVWYRPHGHVATRLLWTPQSAEVGAPLEFPPYRFTGSQKARILAGLETLAQYGERLCDRSWAADRETLARWVSSETPCERLADEQEVVLSPVHGDLNGNNLLLWEEEGEPFLIDFANYQGAGHTMQDFARLEVEVKFRLMDRERLSPLPGLDLTVEQLADWLEMEQHLVSREWEAALALEGAERQYVRRALALIKGIREKAREVHAETLGGSDTADRFVHEYASALLYHTARAVYYDSLPVLKRLLATYSAARLIEVLAALNQPHVHR